MRGNAMAVVVALLCVSSLVLAAPLLQPDLGGVTDSSADPFAGDEYDDEDRERFADDSNPIDEETTGGISGAVGELQYGAVQTFYWRTGSYDRYTGDGWERTSEPNAYAPPHEFDGLAERQRFDITAETAMGIVPAPYQPVAVDAADTGDAAVVVRDDGAFELTDRIAADTPMTVTSDVPEWSYEELRAASGDYDPAMIERYGTPRSATPERVTELTDRITAGQSTPYGTAVEIEYWLKNERAYSLEVSPPEGDVVDEFLHEMDAGYCVYFASAMVEMLRTQDVPARYVTGYSRASIDDDGVEEVTADRAHAWVEVYFDDVGWVIFDPTPPERDEARLGDGEQTAISDAFEPGMNYAQHDADEDWETVDADVELLSEPIPGTDGTVRVTDAGAPLSDHRVSYNGDVVGLTDEHGEVTGTLPYARSLNVTVERYTAPGEPDEEEIEDETDETDETDDDADADDGEDESDADDGEDESDGDEGEGDESDGDESDGDESDGDESDGDESDGDESDGDESDGDESDGDESDGDESDGDESDGDESDGDESDGDESDGDEGEGDAEGDAEGDEIEGDADTPFDGSSGGGSGSIGFVDPSDEQSIGGPIDELPDEPIFSVHHDSADDQPKVASETDLGDRLFASGASLAGLTASPFIANSDGIPLDTDIDVTLDDDEPLHPGSTVGLVATIRGNPVSDATVTVGDETYTTDENGTVDIDVPYTDSVAVEVARESATGTRDAAVATDLSVAFADDPVPGTEATVRATIDDRPVDGIQLIVDDAAIARTDANGTATVPIDYAESVRVVASRDAVSGAATAALPTEIDVDTGWLVLPGGSVSLTATVDGVPVSNATVTTPESADIETDENGTAELSVPLSPRASLAYTVERGAATGAGSLDLLRSWLVTALVALGVGAGVVRRVNLRAGGRRVAGGTARFTGFLAALPRRVVTGIIRVAAWGKDLFARGGRGAFGTLRALIVGLLAGCRRVSAAVPRLLVALAAAIRATGSRLIGALRWLFVGPRTWLERLRSRDGDSERGPGPGANTTDPAASGGDTASTEQRTPPRAIVLRAWQWLLGVVNPPSTMTPAEIADRATGLGLPERYVRRILDAFRALRYGDRSPSAEDAEAVADAERSLRSTAEGEE